MEILQQTIQAAESVLTSAADIELKIATVDAYVESLNKLLIALPAADEGTGFTREGLERLEALHQQVIAVAVGLLGDTSGDLRQLQAKGKAILAYTDTMPKRVSLGAKNKG